MMGTVWAPWLTRGATHCGTWPTSGPPASPGMVTGKVWWHWWSGPGPLSSHPLAGSKACGWAWAGQAWRAVVRSMALVVRA